MLRWCERDVVVSCQIICKPILVCYHRIVYFRILPSIQSRLNINPGSVNFLQEIFIRFRIGLGVLGPERLYIENALISVLTQELQASTRPLTISICDHPDRFNYPSSGCMKTVAQAISTILSTRPFKVQIQNLRLGNYKWLLHYGRPSDNPSSGRATNGRDWGLFSRSRA